VAAPEQPEPVSLPVPRVRSDAPVVILRSLYELSHRENLVGDPDYEYKPVSWVVTLKNDGSFVQIADHRINRDEGKTSKSGKPLKAKWVGKQEEVPVQPGRTSGDRSFAFVDKVEYALGIDPAGKRSAEKLAIRSRLFRDIVRDCADATDDEPVRGVAIFLETEPGTRDDVLGAIPEDLAANELIAFRLAGAPEFVHNRRAVREWWKAQRAHDAPSETPRYHCLVSGEPMDETGLVPQIKPVPGGTPSGVALVSFNFSAAESYGLDGNENAPISESAAQHVAASMNRLLNKSPINAEGKDLGVRRIGLSADTVVLYWSPCGDPGTMDVLNALPDLVDANPTERVGELFRSVWSGRAPEIRDPSKFYALIVTGTQGRAVIRGTLDTTMGRAVRSLAVHFDALSNVRNASPGKGKEPPPAIPLRSLLESLAAPGRESAVPASLAADIAIAALDDRLVYPLSALQRALVRERAEAGGDDWKAASRKDARASLIKAVLTRHFNLEPETTMNPTTENAGYQLGMLTAVLERLQALAIENANATLVDRYFSSASATPAAVFPRLLKLARHHVRKAEGLDGSAPAFARRYDRLIDAIADRFEFDPKKYSRAPGAFPNHLSLPEQGLFVLGYHQMRHWLWMNEQERISWEKAHSDAPRAFLWKTKAEHEEPETATA